MLVKVRSKATGNEGFITPKAYNLAKKSYVFLGNAEDGADLYDPNQSTQTQSVTQSQVQSEQNQTESQSPNPKAQVDEKESVAAPVEDKKQRGRKSKKTSSQNATVES
jgi:hypothetical protein